MLVTFVSQCEKKSRSRTKRVLDAFADRIGSGVWQTTITHEGLNAVERQLRSTATKNTAVCCHWHRSRVKTDVVWVVGNRRKFNVEGRIPVNRTAADLLHANWENEWKYATSLQIAATIAALIHDLGKATVGFQAKLTERRSSTAQQGDPYRHEWISLHLFVQLVGDSQTDSDWLARLSDLSKHLDTGGQLSGLLEWSNKDLRAIDISRLPPLAQIVGWLVVTHHRLPFFDHEYFRARIRQDKRKDKEHLADDVSQTLRSIRPVKRWVLNEKTYAGGDYSEDYNKLKEVIYSSAGWQKAISRWCQKALQDHVLLEAAEYLRADPWFMHLARMCLMLGDHSYSSLSKPESERVVPSPATPEITLWANTEKNEQAERTPKQALDQHLLGVAHKTALITRVLPRLRDHLPGLAAHQGSRFKRRTQAAAFNWQNKAHDLCVRVRTQANAEGFFGVNLASTGHGKTLGNARIMHALADPEKSVRLTIAQGLRVLTVQTGQALRERLGLSEDALAILVGGTVSGAYVDSTSEEEANFEEVPGSESAQSIVTEEIYPPDLDEVEGILPTILAQPRSRKLVGAPIVSCTIDHLVQATESLRGGSQIAPMLRLMTSDLILDELDDFDQWDLPAVSRLVHFAGMLGSKVLVSSATLPPDLLIGLFQAYRSGRQRWQYQTAGAVLDSDPNIVCAWVDEDKVKAQICADEAAFKSVHEQFVEKRAQRLQSKPPRRSAEIIEPDLSELSEDQSFDWLGLARCLLGNALDLHQRYHDSQSGKTASVGLIRFANIQPLIHTVKACYQLENLFPDVHFHICCYHSQFLLAQRNALEEDLDRLLKRTDQHNLFNDSLVLNAVRCSSRRHHVFIVAATSVAEVGRDHDYDWSIVDPSSMRSIIQLVGRVWRHRPHKVLEQPNVRILDANIKALLQGSTLGVGQQPVFEKPGFESKDGFLLDSHRVSELLSTDELANLNAVPRITRPERLQTTNRLADLEHGVMQSFFNDPQINFINGFWAPQTANTLTGHVQLLTPFRLQRGRQLELVCQLQPDDDDRLVFFRQEDWRKFDSFAPTINDHFSEESLVLADDGVSPWLNERLSAALHRLSERYDKRDVKELAFKFATVPLTVPPERYGPPHWFYHPLLGFWY
jgi:CRISPR-associated endonuclease/helicase Cas3